MLKILISNWPVKLIAILAATLLWFYVASSESRVGDFPGKLPLEYRNVPEGLETISDVEEVQIKLVAEGIVWQRLSAASFEAYVDLAGLPLGTHELEVKINVKTVGVSIVEIKPNKILVRLEPVAKKEVPVHVQISGKPAEGLVIDIPVSEPETVSVSGAQSVVENIFEATAKLVLSGESSDITKSVPLVVLDSEGEIIKNLTFEPKEVKIILPLSKFGKNKTVGVVAKFIGTSAGGFYVSKVEIDPPTVTISGKTANIQNIDSVATRPIDISGISASVTKTASLDLPEGTALLGDLERVTVKITVSSQTASREIIVGLNYKNLASNLKVDSISPSQIKAQVSCPQNILDTLSSSNVVLNLDLSGKGAGSFNLDIGPGQVSTPEGCSVSSVLPSSVSVTLGNK